MLDARRVVVEATLGMDIATRYANVGSLFAQALRALGGKH